uniref:Uncharacterized protein n=1 Tax=Anopheles atroparvus TaxID=41427 RepID=A0A182JL98_ANOAO
MAAVGSLLMNSYASVVRSYASCARGVHSPLFVSRNACARKRSSKRPQAHSYGAWQVSALGFAQSGMRGQQTASTTMISSSTRQTTMSSRNGRSDFFDTSNSFSRRSYMPGGTK